MEKKDTYLIFWFIAIAFILWYIADSIKKSTQQSALTGAGSDPISLIATKIKQALNPSGVSVLMSFDFTNLTSLYEAAAEIGQNYTKVAEKYALLYDSNLTSDLQSELTNSEYVKFFKTVNNTQPTTTPNGTGGTNTVTDFAIGKRVKCLKNVNLRKPSSPFAVDKVLTAGTIIDAVIERRVFYFINNVKYNGFLINYKWLGFIPDYRIVSSDSGITQPVT